MPRNHPERDLAKACTELLQLDGFRAIPMEPISRREWGKGFGEIGMADYLYIRYEPVSLIVKNAKAEVVWVEYKSPRGKPTRAQLLWHDAERKRGAVTAIATVNFAPTIEDFFIWYCAAGLNRRLTQPERKSA